MNEQETRTGRRQGNLNISNISGGFTDEEFSDELVSHSRVGVQQDARFQFNFLGADLERVNSARNIRREIIKQP